MNTSSSLFRTLLGAACLVASVAAQAGVSLNGTSFNGLSLNGTALGGLSVQPPAGPAKPADAPAAAP